MWIEIECHISLVTVVSPGRRPGSNACIEYLVCSMYNRVVRFSFFGVFFKRAFQHSIIGTHTVHIRQEDRKILLKPHGKLKVYVVTLYTDEEGKVNVFSSYIVKMSGF